MFTHGRANKAAAAARLMNVAANPCLIHKHTGCLYNTYADPPFFSVSIYKPRSMQGKERGQFTQCPSRPTHGPSGAAGARLRGAIIRVTSWESQPRETGEVTDGGGER